MKNYAWYEIIKKAYHHGVLKEMIKSVRRGALEGEFLSRYINRKELLRKKEESHLFDNYLKACGYRIISIYSPYYPPLLKYIFDPPIAFFFKGNPSLLKEPMISVVGSRVCPKLYLKKAFNLGNGLSKAGWVVVSGLAKGIDGRAHAGALSGTGKTIGVLGTGINRGYPYENRKVQEEIGRVGGLISEFPLNAKPLKYHFPRRNRIISGLSQGLVVLYGQKRSGAFITLDFALEEGRDIFSPLAIEDLIECETYRLNKLKAYGNHRLSLGYGGFEKIIGERMTGD